MQGQDGQFKCSTCNVSFDTPSEYYQHEREVVHTSSGTFKCSDCEESFQIPYDKPAEHKLKEKQLTPSFQCPDCVSKQEQRIIEKLQKEGKIPKVKNH